MAWVTQYWLMSSACTGPDSISSVGEIRLHNRRIPLPWLSSCTTQPLLTWIMRTLPVALPPVAMAPLLVNFTSVKNGMVESTGMTCMSLLLLISYSSKLSPTFCKSKTEPLLSIAADPLFYFWGQRVHIRQVLAQASHGAPQVMPGNHLSCGRWQRCSDSINQCSSSSGGVCNAHIPSIETKNKKILSSIGKGAGSRNHGGDIIGPLHAQCSSNS